MRFCYLFIFMLLIASCSNEIAENADTEKSTIRIGEIGTRSTNEWVWQDNDQLTVKANSLTATYTRTSGKWVSGNADFTKELLGPVTANNIGLSFGMQALTAAQSTAAAYRKADYMTGTGSLDFLTINGTIEHQYTDLIIQIAEGNGWSGKFTQTMTDAAGLAVKTSASATTISACHTEAATFRAIVPPANLPKGTNVALATLTLGSSSATPAHLRGKSAAITYTNTNNEADLKGKRLTVSATLDVSLDISITGITVENYTYEDISDVLTP